MAKKYGAWVTEPGRYFRNTETGERITRRQFDKIYGRLAEKGLSSNEAQAKRNRTPEQLLKPARGRSKYKGPEHEKEREIVRRSRERKEVEAIKRERKQWEHALKKPPRVPKEITNRSFKPGHSGRSFTLPLEWEAIEKFRQAAAKNKNVLFYLVGLNFINPATHQKGSFSVIGKRTIDYPFSHADFAELERAAESKSQSSGLNFMFTTAHVHLLLAMEYVRVQREKIKAKEIEKLRLHRGKK